MRFRQEAVSPGHYVLTWRIIMAFKSREQMESERGQRTERAFDNRWKSVLNMRTGESIVVRFLSRGYDVDVPYIYRRHSHAATPVNGFDSYNTICLKPDYCPACELANAARNTRKINDARADKYIKGASDRGVFRVLSTREVALVQEGDKVRRIPIIKDASGTVCMSVQGGGITPASEADQQRMFGNGYIGWEYEGIMALDVSYTEMKPQAQAVLSLAEKVASACACGSKVSEGITKRAARVLQAQDGSLICEANCGNPTSLEIDDFYVRVTCVGSGTAKDFQFELLETGDFPPELQARLTDDKGKQIDVDWTIFKGQMGLQEQVIRGLAPALRQYGISAEQYLQAQQAPTTASSAASRPAGALPSFGAPTGGPAPRTAPVPNFGAGPTSSIPSTTVAPANAAPIASGTQAAPAIPRITIPSLRKG